MKRLLSYSPFNADLAALLLRLIFGGLFIWHGWVKIENYDIYLPMTKDIIGIGAKLTYNLLIFAEFFCGILIPIGFLTRLAVLPIAFSMGVAYFIAHGKDKFEIKELAFLFMVLSLVVFVLGSGRYSIDGMIQKRKPSRL